MNIYNLTLCFCSDIKYQYIGYKIKGKSLWYKRSHRYFPSKKPEIIKGAPLSILSGQFIALGEIYKTLEEKVDKEDNFTASDIKQYLIITPSRYDYIKMKFRIEPKIEEGRGRSNIYTFNKLFEFAVCHMAIINGFSIEMITTLLTNLKDILNNNVKGELKDILTHKG